MQNIQIFDFITKAYRGDLSSDLIGRVEASACFGAYTHGSHRTHDADYEVTAMLLSMSIVACSHTDKKLISTPLYR